MRPEALKWDGSFSAVMQPPGAALRRGGKWQVELEARFANGDTTGAAVDIEGCKEPVVASKKTGPREDEGAPFGQVVRAGESAKLAFAGATLEIPAGALDDDTRITIRPITDVEIPATDETLTNVTAGGRAYRLGPHGLKFGKAIELTIPFDRSRFVGGQAEDDMGAYFFDEEAKRWRQVQTLKGDASRADADRGDGSLHRLHRRHDLDAGSPDRRQLQPERDQGPEGGGSDGGDQPDPAARGEPRRRRAPLVPALGAAGAAGDAAVAGRDLQQQRGQRADGHGLEPADLVDRRRHAVRRRPLQPDARRRRPTRSTARCWSWTPSAQARRFAGPKTYVPPEGRRKVRHDLQNRREPRRSHEKSRSPAGGDRRLPLGGRRQARNALHLRRDVQRARIGPACAASSAGTCRASSTRSATRSSTPTRSGFRLFTTCSRVGWMRRPSRSCSRRSSTPRIATVRTRTTESSSSTTVRRRATPCSRQQRPDVFTNARGGIVEVTDVRLARIQVYENHKTGFDNIRRYDFPYILGSFDKSLLLEHHRGARRLSSPIRTTTPNPGGEFYRHTFKYYGVVKNQTGRIAFDAPVAWSGGPGGHGPVRRARATASTARLAVGGSAARVRRVPRRRAAARRRSRFRCRFRRASRTRTRTRTRRLRGPRRRQRRRPAGLRQPDAACC